MKDYYRILQVDSEAEPEVIEAAYHRLMRKYHPDTLSPEERQSAEVLHKVQELNEAYELLSDVEKRQAYDQLRSANNSMDITGPKAKLPQPQKKAELEKRIYLVRCSTTKRTFKLHLGRRKGWSGPFLVMGFEPLDDSPLSQIQASEKPGLWDKLRSIFIRRKSTPINETVLPTAEETIQELLNAENTLNLGDIDWAGQKCPDCAGESINPNGTRSTWSRCGTCHRLKCVGSATKRIDGYYLTCPWCGATNKTTRSVAAGSKEQSILRGEYQETNGSNTLRLPAQKQKALKDKNQPD